MLSCTLSFNMCSIFVMVTSPQYNNWFTFSEYEEALGGLSSRPVHAREVATVSYSPFKKKKLLFVV